MQLFYLREETPYEAKRLVEIINKQTVSTSREKQPPLDSLQAAGFAQRLKKAMDNDLHDEDETTVVKETKNGYSFRFIGLYDYVDAETGVNLTFFFMPKFVSEKFVSEEAWNDWNADEPNLAVIRKRRNEIRDTVLQAIDWHSHELSKSDDQTEETEERRESILERAVRLLRDYLENGVYTVQRRELEHNGQGEIDWETTIDQYQPVFLKKGGKPRPVYMDYATELAWSDEDHYITRLHQCLVTTWGRKLEELGLSSVLRVNVPPLSEEELDWFGEPDYQVAQIDKELRLQFVTKSRHTLSLMKDLIREMAENKASNRQSLSFGTNGVAQLWEAACAAVLGSELKQPPINQCGLDWERGGSFSDYMPQPIWIRAADKAPSKESGWRLDFIRTWKNEKDQVEKLVILDAKYYDVSWTSDKKISNQPGISDIAKQICYQMAFEDLLQTKPGIGFVNAFLFPSDDSVSPEITRGETVHLGWTSPRRNATAFSDVNLFTVYIPGIELLRRYANREVANGHDEDDWFRQIANGTLKPKHT